MAITQGFVPIGTLKPNPWNTNVVAPENEAKIDASLKELEFFKPITVRTLPDGSMQILGGEHRWESAKRLGHKEVPVFNVGTIPDAKAKLIGAADNARYGEDDPFAFATLMKELGVDIVTKVLPMNDADLQSMFAATSIALDQLDLDANEQLPELPATRVSATHQIMRFKVPVEDVAWIKALIEQRMREKNFTTEDSQTNAGNSIVDILKEHK